VTPIQGKTYFGSDAKTNGNAFKQEANFASNGQILTGIYGNESTVKFESIEGAGKLQWVSFYYQSTSEHFWLISSQPKSSFSQFRARA